MKSRGRGTTVDLHYGSSLPKATPSPSLTLIPTSLLQTICDEANNRYDKSGEVYASTAKQLEVYIVAPHPSSEERDSKTEHLEKPNSNIGQRRA